MIKKLDFSDQEILEGALKIQLEAYRVEAQLIGSTNIPALGETTEHLKDAAEVFWGWFDGDVLLGFVAVEEDEKSLRMSRLVVDPEHFSRGIGTSLLRHVIEVLRKGRPLFVSTGEKNSPARRLYEKSGFSVIRVFLVDEVSIADFRFDETSK